MYPTRYMGALVQRSPIGVVLALLLLWATAPAAADIRARVVRIIDGDTIEVAVGARTEKVRYIGVNAPELRHRARDAEPGGREATDANRCLVQGKSVRLELDVRERDRYGRLLAYVYVGDVMVNAEMVRLGYAQVMTVPPNVAHQPRLVRLQREAREAGRGLWGRPP